MITEYSFSQIFKELYNHFMFGDGKLIDVSNYRTLIRSSVTCCYYFHLEKRISCHKIFQICQTSFVLSYLIFTFIVLIYYKVETIVI